jgi:hypothetical protein
MLLLRSACCRTLPLRICCCCTLYAATAAASTALVPRTCLTGMRWCLCSSKQHPHPPAQTQGYWGHAGLQWRPAHRVQHIGRNGRYATEMLWKSNMLSASVAVTVRRCRNAHSVWRTAANGTRACFIMQNIPCIAWQAVRTMPTSLPDARCLLQANPCFRLALCGTPLPIVLL